MFVDIMLAWSLVQILKSQPMKRPFDVFHAQEKQTTSKSPINAAKKVPWQSQLYRNCKLYICMCTKHTNTLLNWSRTNIMDLI